MGKHLKANVQAYRRRRKYQKRQKIKLLKLNNKSDSDNRSGDLIINVSKKTEDLHLVSSVSDINQDQSTHIKLDENSSLTNSNCDTSDTIDNVSTASSSSARSPFSLSSFESSKTPECICKKKKLNPLRKGAEPYLSDPLYFKMKEYHLLTSRVEKLKKSFLSNKY